MNRELWEPVNITINNSFINTRNIVSLITSPINYIPAIILALSVLSILLIIIGLTLGLKKTRVYSKETWLNILKSILEGPSLLS